jgi:hypothetical protein
MYEIFERQSNIKLRKIKEYCVIKAFREFDIVDQRPVALVDI